MDNNIDSINEWKEYNKKYLTYTTYNFSVIKEIYSNSFHYSDVFDSKEIGKNFYLVKILIDYIVKELPKDFNFNDIEKMISNQKFDLINKNLNQYMFFWYKNKNIGKFQKTYYIGPSRILNMDTIINTNKNINKFYLTTEKNIKECRFRNYLREYETEAEILYEIYFYYNLAMFVIYLICFNKAISELEQNNEFFEVYNKLKQEKCSETQIIDKIFFIYDSLYKEQYNLELTKKELKFVIDLLEKNKNHSIDKKEFVNIEENLYNLDILSLCEFSDDNELKTNISNIIDNNIISCQNELTFDEIIDNIINRDEKVQEIIIKVHKQQALFEKERILNSTTIDDNKKIEEENRLKFLEKQRLLKEKETKRKEEIKEKIKNEELSEIIKYLLGSIFICGLFAYVGYVFCVDNNYNPSYGIIYGIIFPIGLGLIREIKPSTWSYIIYTILYLMLMGNIHLWVGVVILLIFIIGILAFTIHVSHKDRTEEVNKIYDEKYR